jgi:serine/threonine-protein kinase
MKDSIVFRCQKCDVKIEADGSYAGSVAECPNCGNTVMIPAQGVMTGMIIDDFKIESLLGSGVLGEVWQGTQISMRRPVAIKILSPALTLNPQLVARFMQEVKNAGRLNHPNIVSAIKAGSKGDIYYLATNFVKGRSLRGLMNNKMPFDERSALKIAESVAEALLYAWEKHSLMHSDLNPGHVIIDPTGKPKLIDLGISKSIAEDTTITSTGIILGSPPFMSPEQVLGKESLDCRTDIFALGAVLYNMATGHPPYDDINPGKVFIKQLKEPFPSAKERNPKISDNLDRLIETMTARKRVYRQKTWNAVLVDIRLVLKGQSPVTSRPPRSRKSSSQRSEDLPRLREPEYVARKAKLHGVDTIHFRKTKDSGVTFGKNTHALIIILIALFLTIMLGVGIFYAKSDYEETRRVEREKVFAQQLRESQKRRREAQAQKRKLAIDKKIRKEWLSAVAYANKYAKSEGKYDQAIERFERLAVNRAGTKYQKKAEKAVDMLKKAKQKKIDSIIQELHEKSKAFMDKKEYKKAAAVYMNYSGVLKMDTKSLRESFRDECNSKAEWETRNRKRNQEKNSRQREQFISSIAGYVVDGNIKGALEEFKSSKQAAKHFKSLQVSLDALLNRNSLVLETFKADIDKELTLVIDGETEKVIVRGLKDNKVYIDKEYSRGYMVRTSFLVKDLSVQERIRRLAGVNKLAASLYGGILAVKSRDYRLARSYFRESGPLQKYLLDLVKQMDKDSSVFDEEYRY